MEGAQEAFRSCLLADLNQLASEAKRPDSLAGQLTGWISGPEHPLVKDAAERVISKLSEASWTDTLLDVEVSFSCMSNQQPINLRAIHEGKLQWQALSLGCCRRHCALTSSLARPKAPNWPTQALPAFKNCLPATIFIALPTPSSSRSWSRYFQASNWACCFLISTTQAAHVARPGLITS